MVFPVAMYGYESWTIKKAEQPIDAFGFQSRLNAIAQTFLIYNFSFYILIIDAQNFKFWNLERLTVINF